MILASQHTITDAGCWRDGLTPHRAFNLGNKRGYDIASVFRNDFLPELRQSGHTVGYFAVQDGDQIFWSLGENVAYQSFGKVGAVPEAAGRLADLNITIPGFTGVINYAGGAWENHVYVSFFLFILPSVFAFFLACFISTYLPSFHPSTHLSIYPPFFLPSIHPSTSN